MPSRGGNSMLCALMDRHEDVIDAAHNETVLVVLGEYNNFAWVSVLNSRLARYSVGMYCM